MVEINIGGGTGSTLFLVFLVLKLTEVIDWSWWWITAPLWIPLLFWIIVLGVISLIAFFAWILDR